MTTQNTTSEKGPCVLKKLDGLPPGIQAIAAVGTVTARDYERIFAPLVEQATRTDSRMRLLYQFGPGFERITLGALWADTRLGQRYVGLLDGCAVASDIGWIRTPSRAIGSWMPCPVRVYDNDERTDAVAWLASLPQTARVSAYDMAKAYIGGTGAVFGSLGKLVVSQAVKSRHAAR